jgi:ferredoxin-type protein NapF
MSHDANIDVSRRSFLRGKWRNKSEINSQCLNSQGVYCQSCKDSCEAHAIIFKHAGRGIQLPVIDSERCTHCKDCVESCPVDAIEISDAQVN